MIIFLLMNIIVSISSFLLTYRIFKFNNFIDSLILLFILYFSQIILSQLMLGILGILYLKNVILFNLAILLVIWLTVRNKPFYFSGFYRIRESVSELLKDKIILLTLSLILGFALVKIFINLINPPFGWDNLNYHFTFPVEWLKNGNLDNPIVANDDPAPTYYPVNGSLFFLWFILPLKNVFLADLASLPFFIISALVIYAISRILGLERRLSFFSASLFILIPNFFKQLEIAYVDVMVCALFMLSLYYILKLNDKFHLKILILTGICLGLLIGTKNLALIYALPLLLLVFYLCAVNMEKRGIVYGLTFILLVILFGGFSYIRNFIWTGNPLYPIDIQILGKTIFPGVIDKISYSAHFLSEDYRISKLLFHEGLGLQTSLFILPGMLLSLPLIFIRKRNIAMGFSLYFLAILPFLLYLSWRYIIPLANTRYLYPALAVAMIMGFYIVNSFKISLKFIYILFTVCMLASISELAGHQELFFSLAVTVILFFLLIKNYLKIKFIILALVLLLIILPFLERNYVKNEYARYKNSPFWQEAVSSWAWLNNHTQQDNIAYVGRPVPFPLYGSGFKNNVYYTSVNNIDPAKLHFFKDSRYIWDYDFEVCHKNYEAENNYRGRADYQIWLSNLRKRKTDYLFLYSLHQIKTIKFPMEDEWAKQHSEVFEPIFYNNTIHIYKIR